MTEVDARHLLDEFDVLRNPCDLDLLIFFARHPRALLSTGHIGAFSGHGPKDIAASLELLLTAALLTRVPHARHPGRMYELATNESQKATWLAAVTQVASTREGRLALLRELKARRRGQRGPGETTGTLPFPQGSGTDRASGQDKTAASANTADRENGREG